MTTPYRVVVAPDKFKGSLRADEVADALTEVLGTSPRVEVVKHPVADGGEGTVALALSVGFDPVTVEVTGPLGLPVEATFALHEGTAVLEMATAAGLGLLPGAPDPDTAWRATTYGVGQLILAAADRGATRVVVGVGGSATTDGGAGAVEALGTDVGALGSQPHRDGPPGTGLDARLKDVEIVVACDVDNPLLGAAGAAAVYAPQKGADPASVSALEGRLTRWADAVAAATGNDLRDLPGAGAAGGLGFGLAAVAGARIVSGVDLLLELTGFDDVAASADLVIVGEGSMDAQSLRGKGPVGVARAASRRGATVIAVAGRNDLTRVEWEAAGLRAVYSLSAVEPDPAVCMRDARRLLSTIARTIADDWLPSDRDLTVDP
jgi:glycerate kinase